MMLNKVNINCPSFGAGEQYSSKSENYAVAGGTAGAAVVAKGFTTLNNAGKTTGAIGKYALKTSVTNAQKITNIFTRGIEFLKRMKLSWLAKILESKTACKTLGVFGTLGAVGITASEMCRSAEIFNKVNEFIKREEG